jgi:hypothetical protein
MTYTIKQYRVFGGKRSASDKIMRLFCRFLLIGWGVIAVEIPKADSCPDLPNYVPELPGLLGHDVVCNYAGYTFASPYFYWFLVKVNYTRLLDVPLLLDIGGGTESSLTGLFAAGGPYRIVQGHGSLRLNVVKSLLDFANVLYVEQPGIFSFSKERFTGEYTTYVLLNEMIRFLDNFVQANGLSGIQQVYIIADGYMAKLGALLADPRFIQGRRFAVQGLIINNGIYDLARHLTSLASLTATLGAVPKDLAWKLEEANGISHDLIQSNPGEAYARWRRMIEIAREVSGIRQFENSLAGVESAEDVGEALESYLSQEAVQTAIHIRQPTRWQRQAQASAFQRAMGAILNVSTCEYNHLLQSPRHVSVLFAVGAYSPRSSADAFQQWAATARWEHTLQLLDRSRMFLISTNTTLYLTVTPSVIYALYPHEGRVLGTHTLPTYLASIKEFVLTHTLHGIPEQDQLMKELLSDCSGRGYFNQSLAACVCTSVPYSYGADCSLQLQTVEEFPVVWTLAPDQWRYVYLRTPDVPSSLLLESEVVGGNWTLPDGPQIVMAISLDLKQLPNEAENGLLSRNGEIALGQELSDETQRHIILGVKNGGRYKQLRLALTQQSLPSWNDKTLALCLLGLLGCVACLQAGICFYCWRQTKRHQRAAL